MPTRKYSSRSQQTTLTGGINSSATSATVVSGSALLGGITISTGEIFTVVIDPDTALEEIVDITAVSTNTLTIVRAIDGSTGQAHSAGAVVRHMAIGRDYREANAHVENTTTAHGLTLANVVKTTDTGTVANGMIAANAVTTAKITDLNVTTGKLADGAVTSAKIADLGIATGDIADLAITTGKIAAEAVTTAKIPEQAITNSRIAADAVTSDKIAADAVGTSEIANLAVTTGKIADSAITSAKIADLTIATGDIADNAITAAKVADGAVTSGKILDGTVVNADINTSAQIAYGKLNLTNGIVNGDINASAAIALSKLATDPLARANHTGTQTASTISDFDTQVRTSKVTDLAAPTTSVSVNSQKITNLATPTLSTDAATKAYADLMIPLTQKGVANGVAELDADGLVPVHHLPALSITTTQVVASQAAMLALTAQTGDVAVRTDVNKTFILTATPASTLGNWQELLTPTDSVLSVDGQTGAVNLSSTYATVANAANKLPLAGGTMSGAIAMGTNKITGLGDPTSSQDAATKNYIDTVVLAPSNLTGPITSVGNVTSIASQTGTGTKFVVDTSPTLVTPVLGVATATSINGTTIPSSKTLVATDSTAYVVPSQTGNSGKFLTTDGTTSSWGSTLIESSGSIGIGTTSPGVKLDIIGPTGVVTAPTYPNQTSMAIRNNFHTRIVLVNGGAGTYGSQIFSYTPGGANATHDFTMNPNGFVFSIGNTTGSVAVTERMRIGFDGGITIKNAASQTVDSLSIQNSAGTVLAEFDASGNLGVGTTALTTAANYGSITLNGTDGTLWSAKVNGTEVFRIQPTAAGTTINEIANAPLLFNTNNTESMRITASGNVGIGTVPSTKLHVNGVVTATSFTGYITGTNHGVVGNLGVLTPAASSQATWAGYPMGFAQMIAPTANGSPSTTNYTYFLKVSNRDNSGGWGGIAVDHSTGEFYTGVTSTSATYATWKKFAFVANRNDYATVGTLGNVVGQLGWKNFGNGHTIFDASNSTSPDGGAVNNTDAQVAWSASYPTLMGWNGGQTYGVRVDIAKKAEFDPKTQAATTPALRNISMGTAAPSGGVDGDVYIRYA